MVVRESQAANGFALRREATGPRHTLRTDFRCDVAVLAAHVLDPKRVELAKGFAGESRDDFRETIDLLREADPDYCADSIFFPYPKTALYADLTLHLEKGQLMEAELFEEHSAASQEKEAAS